jgi:hypothetical protein
MGAWGGGALIVECRRHQHDGEDVEALEIGEGGSTRGDGFLWQLEWAGTTVGPRNPRQGQRGLNSIGWCRCC